MTGGAFTNESSAFVAQADVPCLDKPIEGAQLESLLATFPSSVGAIELHPRGEYAPGVAP
jgi:hypothetical protein